MTPGGYCQSNRSLFKSTHLFRRCLVHLRFRDFSSLFIRNQWWVFFFFSYRFGGVSGSSVMLWTIIND